MAFPPKYDSCPEVTVIIPVYNAARFLTEAIDSVLAQTVGNWELILVDDRSTDNSLDICNKYADKFPDRIKVIGQPVNGGVSAARNSGLDVAKGEFIVFLDADDCYFENAFHTLLACARRFPEAGIISGRFVTGVEMPEDEHFGNEKIQVIDGSRALKLMLYQSPEFDHSPWAKLYRRELFDGVRFKKGIKFEDMEIFPRLLRKTDKVVLTQSIVYFYRTNGESFMNKWTPQRLDALAITDRILEDTLRDNPELEMAARNLRLSANFTSFFLAAVHDRKDVADQTWEVIRKERFRALKDPNVRLKNKIGVSLSYLGRNILTKIGSGRKKYR